MSIENEAYNETLPLRNTAAMKDIAVLLCDGTSKSQDLTALLTALNKGHFITVAADGGKLYVAQSTAAATIDETATGNGPTVCWAIPDGRYMRVRPIMGTREVSTGIATQVSYNVLNYKGASGTYVRIYASSLDLNQQAGDAFKAP